jgi:hypothetical protein
MSNTKGVVDQIYRGHTDIGFVEGMIDNPNPAFVAAAEDELVPRSKWEMLRAWTFRFRDAASSPSATRSDMSRGPSRLVST